MDGRIEKEDIMKDIVANRDIMNLLLTKPSLNENETKLRSYTLFIMLLKFNASRTDTE